MSIGVFQMVSDSVLAVQVLAKRLTATANIIFCIVVMIYVANNRQLIFTIILSSYFETLLHVRFGDYPHSELFGSSE